MSDADSTCWTMVEGAGRGDAAAQSWFAREYGPLVERYLAARWAGSARRQEIADATQEVFLECYRDGGALAKVDRDRGRSFRAFLFGIVRNVARRIEGTPARRSETALTSEAPEPTSREATLSVLFDRTWARKMMADAAREQRRAATEAGGEALRRVELLELRFQRGLAIREIAAEWQEDPTHLHRQYALAREEFRRALFRVLEQVQGGSAENLEQECSFLLSLLGGEGSDRPDAEDAAQA